MYLTTKIQVATDNKMSINTDILNRLCYHSARLYNVALYSVRQHYFKERKSNGLNPDDVRALVNAPCKRLNAFSQTPFFRWG